MFTRTSHPQSERGIGGSMVSRIQSFSMQDAIEEALKANYDLTFADLEVLENEDASLLTTEQKLLLEKCKRPSWIAIHMTIEEAIAIGRKEIKKLRNEE